MKKVLFILCSLFVFATVTNAQTADEQKAAPTKEEKQKMKEKQEADFAAAFKAAGLTDDQIKQAKAAMQEASEKGKEIKKDAALSEDEKKAKLKEISDAKNAKLKEIMGDKYKAYSAERKKQKEAAGNGND
jgi:helix-turn-helix protein